MELRHLRYFAAVAEHLSFTKAAKAVRVAQPALSRQIRDLEQEVGVELLLRNQRSVSLTQAGRAFLEEARKILRQSDEAIKIAQGSGSSAVGPLNVGYVWGLFHTLAPAGLTRMRRDFPAASVHLFDMTSEEQRSALDEGRIDAGFIGLASDAVVSGFSSKKVAECEFVAALPEGHPAARKKVVDLSSLAHEFFIAISERAYPATAKTVLEICGDSGLRPRVLQTAERGYLAIGLVGAGCGVALLPESLRAVPHPGVVFRPVTGRPKRDLHVAWKKGRSSTLLEALLRAVG